MKINQSIYSAIRMEYPRNGIMLYCFKSNEGCLIIGNKIPLGIYKNDTSYEWEDIGTFKIDKYGIVSLFPSDSEWMLDVSDKWPESEFLVNIYDESLNLVTLPKQNGIVLKCFETNNVCFLLSETIPLKGLNKITSSNLEDIGTFHIQNNKIVYHGDEAIPYGNIYDVNLQKVNIPSY